jgi:PIN domain nuclease of toxin-antitoxin system
MAIELVVDASVVIAVLRGEPLDPRTVARLANATICATNYAEIITYIAKLNDPTQRLRHLVGGFGLVVAPLDEDRAAAAGELPPRTASSGLSLGDRCCLSLARKLELPALTTDRAWIKIADAVGVKVELAR